MKWQRNEAIYFEHTFGPHFSISFGKLSNHKPSEASTSTVFLYPHVKALMDDPLFMEELFETPVDYNIDYYDDDVLDDFMNDYFN